MSLADSDLVVDKIYSGLRRGDARDDPPPELLGVSRGGGFRYIGDRSSLSSLRLVVFKTAFNDPDWPDHLDHETGLFIYYGDNKRPGRMLHDTPRGGNLILSHLFSGRHDPGITGHFPAILLFARAGEYRDVRFLGLAVPGSTDLGPEDDLVAIWRTAANGFRTTAPCSRCLMSIRSAVCGCPTSSREMVHNPSTFRRYGWIGYDTDATSHWPRRTALRYEPVINRSRPTEMVLQSSIWFTAPSKTTHTPLKPAPLNLPS